MAEYIQNQIPDGETEIIIDGQKYIVQAFYSAKATETAADKIKRLLVNDCRQEGKKSVGLRQKL
jgi:hypothetical protein